MILFSRSLSEPIIRQRRLTSDLVKMFLQIESWCEQRMLAAQLIKTNANPRDSSLITNGVRNKAGGGWG